MSTNDITGDRIISKSSNDKFRSNFDGIFKKKAPAPAAPATCKKCRADVNIRCDYCGLLQADGSILAAWAAAKEAFAKNAAKKQSSLENPPNNSLEEIT